MRFSLALLIMSAAAVTSPSAVTFSKDVFPILQNNCQVCHRPGEIGPMSFLTYDATRPWAKAIKEAVLTRQMPPWFADSNIGHFANERRLRDSEIKTIVEWVDAGAPEGDPQNRPAPIQWTDGWNIKPDVVYEMPKPYTVPVKGTVDNFLILLPAKFAEDTWIIDGEIRPGDRSVVHHANLIVRPPGSRWMKDAKVGEPCIPGKNTEGAVTTTEASDNTAHDWFVGYVPGMDPQRYFYPEQAAGRLIPAGSDIFLEMHYTANGKQTKDQTKVGFVLAKEPPAKRLQNLVIMDWHFEIPPNAPNFSYSTWAILNESAALIYTQPHLHMRGIEMEIKLTYPDGRSEIVLSVPRYNYLWQIIYVQNKPLQLPKGTRIDVSAAWDNSANNKFNPDPSKPIRWGPQSWDEMFVAYIGVTVEQNVDPNLILSMPSITVTEPATDTQCLQTPATAPVVAPENREGQTSLLPTIQTLSEAGAGRRE
jgi:hypothetical protein